MNLFILPSVILFFTYLASAFQAATGSLLLDLVRPLRSFFRSDSVPSDLSQLLQKNVELERRHHLTCFKYQWI
jgi:hypothetical protein